MIYTVGPKKIYKAQIQVWGTLFKVGRSEKYRGGCAFQSIADAQRWIEEYKKGKDNREFGVFGLEAEWGKDTEPSEDEWWHYLLHNRQVVPLD
jgi:hypothetical protein